MAEELVTMKRLSLALSLAFLSIGILNYPRLISAHITGKNFEKIEGSYLVDIGYSPDELIAGDPTIFDFDLIESSKSATFLYTWVKIKQGQSVIFE